MSLAAARIANLLRRAEVETRGRHRRPTGFAPARLSVASPPPLQSPTWAEVGCVPTRWGFVRCCYERSAREVATMYAQECLKRTAECARLAEATNDPGLRKYLTKLALSWMQSTTMAERNKRLPADGHQRRRLKKVHDLFS